MGIVPDAHSRKVAYGHRRPVFRRRHPMPLYVIRRPHPRRECAESMRTPVAAHSANFRNVHTNTLRRRS